MIAGMQWLCNDVVNPEGYVLSALHFLCSPKENEAKEKAPYFRIFFDPKVEKPLKKIHLDIILHFPFQIFLNYSENKGF